MVVVAVVADRGDLGVILLGGAMLDPRNPPGIQGQSLEGKGVGTYR